MSHLNSPWPFYFGGFLSLNIVTGMFSPSPFRLCALSPEVGRREGSSSEEIGKPENITSHSQRWHKICELLDQFWSIFLEKTLLELRNTKKWQVEQTQLAEGDLVVEIDSTQPRGCWKLAIVEQIHPSDDSKVRKVTIRNSKGQYLRPIVNLIPLNQKLFRGSAEVANCNPLNND